MNVGNEHIYSYLSSDNYKSIEKEFIEEVIDSLLNSKKWKVEESFIIKEDSGIYIYISDDYDPNAFITNWLCFNDNIYGLRLKVDFRCEKIHLKYSSHKAMLRKAVKKFILKKKNNIRYEKIEKAVKELYK